MLDDIASNMGDGNCVGVDNEGEIYSETFSFNPGFAFYLILVCTSLLFLGLFTTIEPLLESKKISWTKAVQNNWQVFAIVAIIIFLWRVNILVANI